MQESKIMDQINAIFGAFMVVFYLGVGIYMLFFLKYLDKPLRVIIGGTFIFYGLYRLFRAIVKIKEAFFQRKKDEE